MPAPANDTCATAIDITTLLPYTASVDTTLANHDSGLPAGSGYSMAFQTAPEYTAWYVITPADDVRLHIKTTGYDSVIQVYSGTCGSLTPIDANNSWGVGALSSAQQMARLMVDLTGGVTYYICIGSDALAGGTLGVDIQETCYPLFRSINPVTSGGSGIVTVNVPGSPKGPDSGDDVYVFLCHEDSDYSTVQPSGFALIDRGTSGTVRAELWKKTAGANEIALTTYTFELPIGASAMASLGFAFAVKGGTLDAHSVRANSTGSTGTTSVTATKPYSWIISLGAKSLIATPFAAWATGAPGSLSLEEIEDTTNNAGTDIAVGMAAIQMTPAGATGDSTWTPTADDSVGFLLAIGAESCETVDVPDPDPGELMGATPEPSCCGGENATGPILPPTDTTWTANCDGGGTVPTAADLTDSENWDD